VRCPSYWRRLHEPVIIWKGYRRPWTRHFFDVFVTRSSSASALMKIRRRKGQSLFNEPRCRPDVERRQASRLSAFLSLIYATAVWSFGWYPWNVLLLLPLLRSSRSKIVFTSCFDYLTRMLLSRHRFKQNCQTLSIGDPRARSQR
jgi:hypothetical protein